jgi:hypothetical protein
MLLETIAIKVLINAGKATTESGALQLLKSEYKTHYPSKSYDVWNMNIPDVLGEVIAVRLGKYQQITPRYIIDDLYQSSRMPLKLKKPPIGGFTF